MTSATQPYPFLDRPAVRPRGSVTQHVTEALRQAIVTLDLPPGTVIDKGAVCARLGVSRFPVSEALARLSAEGLVDILPQRGSVVSLVRIADVGEYMLIRKALECEAVRTLVGIRTPDLLEKLRRVMAQQQAAADSGDRAGFHARDLDFHEVLVDATGLIKVKAIIESARANLDRARRLIITPRRLVHTLAEHQAITDAIATGDAYAAEAAMRGHITAVMTELMEFAAENPALFADGDTNPTLRRQ